jgi:hypothetical protein
VLFTSATRNESRSARDAQIRVAFHAKLSCVLIYTHLPFLAVWVRRTEGPYLMRAFGLFSENLFAAEGCRRNAAIDRSCGTRR